MLQDAALVGASFVAVSTSPAMPGWPEYQCRVEADRPYVEAREASEHELVSALGGRRLLPGTTRLRAIATLVSFTDDHAMPLPEEMLPRVQALALIERLARAARALSVAEQFALALSIEDDAWTALAALHLATRQLARGRDVRALGVDAPTGIAERCVIGRAIAAFPERLSQNGDPLGDTYHYWANVMAGALAMHEGGPVGWGIERLFHAGPVLMTLVRERAFGSRLFYGNHARVDREGLRHGIALRRLAFVRGWAEIGTGSRT